MRLGFPEKLAEVLIHLKIIEAIFRAQPSHT